MANRASNWPIKAITVIVGPKIEKSWNFEFRASKIMKSGFYYTKMKQKT